MFGVGKFTADIRNFNKKLLRNADLIVKDAAQGVFSEMSQRQASVTETGGSFVVGKVPVDTGALVNSLFSRVNGAKVGEGELSYVAALAGAEMGDVIEFSFSSEYAPHIEYGTQHFAGRFMVREAINGAGGWPARVDASARKYQG